MTVTKQSDRIGSDRALMAGIAKRLSTSAGIVLSGANHTPAELVATLKSRVDAEVAVQNAHAALAAAITAAQKVRSDTKQLVADLRQTLLAMYRGSPDALVDFGISPRKQRRALTADEMVTAATRAAATRKARGTVGRRKKLAIKGDVSVKTETSPATATSAPAAPAPTPAPVNGAPKTIP